MNTLRRAAAAGLAESRRLCTLAASLAAARVDSLAASKATLAAALRGSAAVSDWDCHGGRRRPVPAGPGPGRPGSLTTASDSETCGPLGRATVTVTDTVTLRRSR